MSQQLSSTENLPELMKETDIKLIMEFAAKQGAKTNEQMLDVLLKSDAVDVRVAKLNGVILGMRVFQRVVNPMRGTMGYAMLEDWSNGFVGLDPT